jgi:cellobiose phosphorylase
VDREDVLGRGSVIRFEGGSGLIFEMDLNGSVFKVSHGGIMLNLFIGGMTDGSVANIYLKTRDGNGSVVPLLGPRSPSVFSFEGRFEATGRALGLEYSVHLVLAESISAWTWVVRLRNISMSSKEIELLHVQDLGLAQYGAIRINEYYTSHYIDHTPLKHERMGYMVASRQNLPMAGKHPWAMLGSLRRAVGFATDGLQIYGLEGRKGYALPVLKGGLPSSRLQHEHSIVAIQDSVLRLDGGEEAVAGFFGVFLEDHPSASSADDLTIADDCISVLHGSSNVKKAGVAGVRPCQSLFSGGKVLDALNLDEDEIGLFFPGERVEEERRDGKLLSFFTGGGRHVVLKAKELLVLRPHANIMRSGSLLVPDEEAMTTTAWMGGVFNSMLTQGHVAINRFLSTVHSYLGLFDANGQRIFVEIDGEMNLLRVPSAFEMGINHCRWIYKHDKAVIEVISEALFDRHLIRILLAVLSGKPMRFLLSHHLAIDGDDGVSGRPPSYRMEGTSIVVSPRPGTELGSRFPEGWFRITSHGAKDIEAVGGDEMLFRDGLSRGQPFLCLLTAPCSSFGLDIEGGLIRGGAVRVESERPEAKDIYEPPRLIPREDSEDGHQASRLSVIMPWFVQNALVHYLAPRGTEQYTGGGWGTRDICQGPVEMLLGLGRIEPVREILQEVFKAQNKDGDWPQWFMFFDRERNIRAGDSHGDIVFWPLNALASYLLYSGDKGFLDRKAPFFHPEGDSKAEHAAIMEHVERALSLISRRVVPGTCLAAYGHGDWNDSMQPFDPEMRERLCSAWTVTLQYQTMTALSAAFDAVGMKERSLDLINRAKEVREAFRGLLLKDGILAGFAHFRQEGIEYLLHPSDEKTGVSFRLLPMIHAIINDMLTKEEAERHITIIKERLLGPDGARLFDRPMEYRGGVMKRFQRAESAAYFGREIGLMYTHAHLRYAEALARFGDSRGFFKALCQANPVGLKGIVPSASLRQANCYYSSSDAAFGDRYEALRDYRKVMTGEIPLEGGWRIYSSGPGIWTRLFIQNLLGLRIERDRVIIDPVIPPTLDGLKAEIRLSGMDLAITYRTGALGAGPERVISAGRDLPFERRPNPYRSGAVEIPRNELLKGLTGSTVDVTVILG